MMKETVLVSKKTLLPVQVNAADLNWLLVGGDGLAAKHLKALAQQVPDLSITLIAPRISEELLAIAETIPGITIAEREYRSSDLTGIHLLIIATGDVVKDTLIHEEAASQNILAFLPADADDSDFVLPAQLPLARDVNGHGKAATVVTKQTDPYWKGLASKLVLAFFLMVLGHLVISYLPLPSIKAIWQDAQPYFDKQFLFFILAGFLAQMVDGVLSMGYGVTSATCLISFGVNPVAMSAAIHTSEIFSTGISGYSHYKFGNVNKKLFRHLVVPGVLGAILGALMLVFLGEKAGSWLMPAVALYAFFLGVKILIKAFQVQTKSKKVKRVGWLAWLGGFLDSFGGGGWGPIVTSTLISKGRSPKYTIGSVSMTEFFVTLASAVTFFISAGVSHWNVVLGLLLGGAIAAPIAARLAGKLPRKTMMIAVGIMVMIWCVRMIVKSFA